jgi:hypothetical protein
LSCLNLLLPYTRLLPIDKAWHPNQHLPSRLEG